MIKNLKYFVPAFVVLGLFVLFNATARANPSYVPQTAQTATATTSPTTMGTGLATTTLTYDSYTQGSTNKSDVVTLFQQVTASTSAAIIDYTVEYSNDGIDYFGQDALPSSFAAGQATFFHSTSTPTNRWQAGSTLASTTRKATVYTLPTRFVRFTFTNPVGESSVNLQLWAQVVPTKEKPE